MNRQPFYSGGGNPFSNFNPITTNNMPNGNNNGYNYNNGFAPNSQIIERTDFKNHGNVLHNNLGNSLFAENIIEYQLWIDSVDRDISMYPNPFKFITTFGGAGAQSINKKTISKNNSSGNQTVSNEKIYFKGSAGPIIDRKFKNVKYIKLDHVILPKSTVFNLDQSFNVEVASNAQYHLEKYRYLIVKIREIASEFTFSTNSIIGNDSFIIYKDSCCGNNSTMWCPEGSGSKIYLNSALGNLDRLSLTIMDPKGNVLAVTNQFGEPIKDTEFYEQIDCLNCLYSFQVGVFENELTTEVKYEQ
jgi:hypothetical protein